MKKREEEEKQKEQEQMMRDQAYQEMSKDGQI